MFSQRQSKAEKIGRRPKRRPGRHMEPAADRRRLAQAMWDNPANWRDADDKPGVPGPGDAVIFEKR